MTPGGWLFLLLTWGLIIVVAIYCFYRVFHDDDNETMSEANK